jgi:hypothetical protein
METGRMYLKYNAYCRELVCFFEKKINLQIEISLKSSALAQSYKQDSSIRLCDGLLPEDTDGTASRQPIYRTYPQPVENSTELPYFSN